ncbi:MAG TPA: BLUF domain-containing protein [Azospira sp.]|nr:BLUF domain-containing protein [Azospira sp.]
MENAGLSIVYVSAATHPMSDAELEALLHKAREHNACHGISGLLLYGDGNFMQLLEGPPDEVAALYGRIQRDPRHHMVTTVLEEPDLPREFADWSMAYRRVDAPTWLRITELAGVGGPPVQLSVVKGLLASFWKSVT